MRDWITRDTAGCARRIGARFLAIAGILCLSAIVIWIRPATAETVSPIFEQALPNAGGKTMTVVMVDFAPSMRASPHRHGQAFLFAYVLQGTIRSQIEGQPPRTYVTGQSWPEPPGSHHVLTENLSATEPARLLVVFVADTGAVLKVDDPQTGAK